MQALHAQEGQPGGSHLDRQRYAVELTANVDRAGHRGITEREVRIGRPGAVLQQLHGGKVARRSQ
jgi:hypothetical protein